MNYEDLPNKAQLDDYVKNGMPVGDFLRALLENDLKATFAHADERNLPYIHLYVKYLYNRCPQRCWGSPNAVAIWMAEFEFTR